MNPIGLKTSLGEEWWWLGNVNLETLEGTGYHDNKLLKMRWLLDGRVQSAYSRVGDIFFHAFRVIVTPVLLSSNSRDWVTHCHWASIWSRKSLRNTNTSFWKSGYSSSVFQCCPLRTWITICANKTQIFQRPWKSKGDLERTFSQ